MQVIVCKFIENVKKTTFLNFVGKDVLIKC